MNPENAPELALLRKRLADVNSKIAESCRAAGRTVNECKLIVVTKFHPVELISELVAAGVTNVGESRHQEAQAKAQALSDAPLQWHFIGQLQGKKVRQIARYADVLHAIDRERVVDALDVSLAELGRERTLEGFIQVNLTDDPNRGGVAPQHLETLVERVLKCSSVQLNGVMAVAPLHGNTEAAFERLRECSERVRSLAPDATAISAGMSHDFQQAIAAGATHLRIGSAITGNRVTTR